VALSIFALIFAIFFNDAGGIFVQLSCRRNSQSSEEFRNFAIFFNAGGIFVQLSCRRNSQTSEEFRIFAIFFNAGGICVQLSCRRNSQTSEEFRNFLLSVALSIFAVIFAIFPRYDRKTRKNGRSVNAGGICVGNALTM
jgi:hypothetical protein